MTKFLFLTILFLTQGLSASPDSSYAQGKAFAPNLALPVQFSLSEIPGFGGADVEISQRDLEGDAKKGFGGDVKDLVVDAAAKNEEAKVHHDVREENPFLRASHEISENPLKELGGAEVATTETRQTETVQKTCEEGVPFELKTRLTLNYSKPERQERETVLTIYYPDYIRKVGRRNDEMGPLSVTKRDHQVDIERFRTYACPHFEPVDAKTGKRYKIECHRIKNFRLVATTDTSRVEVTDRYGDKCNPIKYMKIAYKHDTFQGDEQGTENGWAFDAPDISDKLSRYNCTLKTERCVDSRPRQFDELTVTKPCWEKELSYACGVDLNTCQDLQSKGCTLTGSSCKEPHPQGCAVFEKSYACQESTRVLHNKGHGGNLPFCLAGDCHELEITEDQDFHEAVSKLAVLGDMQKQLEKEGPTVFKGTQDTCTRDFASFRDCCGSCKGWGVSVGFKGCTAEEKTLSERRAKGLCRYIGTYCSKRFLGICLTQKSVFCCFPSKLARVFHEKGRAQIGRSWGDAQSPDCGPFTIEEIQKIDWNKIDLSEVFQDVFAGTDLQKKMVGAFRGEMPKIRQKAQKGACHDLVA